MPLSELLSFYEGVDPGNSDDLRRIQAHIQRVKECFPQAGDLYAKLDEYTDAIAQHEAVIPDPSVERFHAAHLRRLSDERQKIRGQLLEFEAGIEGYPIDILD